MGSDNGCLRLYDISKTQTKGEDSYCNSTLIFDDFELLTSVHINSTDDRCLTSGYSRKVALYDICSGRRLQLFTDMHQEPINVAKFSNHSPNLFVTSSFDRDVKMWDSRQKPSQPCYASRSSRGNVMVVFSPDDLYLLVSAIDNEVQQLTLHSLCSCKCSRFIKQSIEHVANTTFSGEATFGCRWSTSDRFRDSFKGKLS